MTLAVDRCEPGLAGRGLIAVGGFDGPVKLPKRHGPTLFLVIMVLIMAFVMSLVLGFASGAFEDGFLRVWPRQFLVAFVVALPAAYVARRMATSVVARLTE